MGRIFGVERVELLHPDGLAALRKLVAVAQRVRAALADLGGDIARAAEIGSGHELDKVLVARRGVRYQVSSRGLFRCSALPILTVHAPSPPHIPYEPNIPL